MNAISKVLTADHRRCDGLFAAAEAAVRRRDWATCRVQFVAFDDALRHHFEVEEAAVFPAFEQATGMTAGPTAMMRNEHEQMRAILDDMAAAIAANRFDRCLGQSGMLLMFMQQHNLKEENVLYPMADQALVADAIDVGRHFAAHA